MYVCVYIHIYIYIYICMHYIILCFYIYRARVGTHILWFFLSWLLIMVDIILIDIITYHCYCWCYNTYYIIILSVIFVFVFICLKYSTYVYNIYHDLNSEDAPGLAWGRPAVAVPAPTPRLPGSGPPVGRAPRGFAWQHVVWWYIYIYIYIYDRKY